MEQSVMTRVYSNQTRKKSIQNVLVEDAPPITIEGVDYYLCGFFVGDKNVGDTLYRNKVLRALTSLKSNVNATTGVEYTERILIIG